MCYISIKIGGIEMKEKYAQELAEYRKFGEEIKETLESNYYLSIHNKEFDRAYETLGKLMGFKLISADDPRIEKNNKSYIAGGIDKTHRFTLDYRTSLTFIPDWLYGNIKGLHKFKMDTIEHIGKRVEGNYEGDTVFHSHQFVIKIQSCGNNKAVDNTLDDVNKLLTKAGKKVTLSDIKEMAKSGAYRVFSITAESACIDRFKTMGAIIVKQGDSEIECSLIVNYESLFENWLDIKDFLNKVQLTFNDMAGQKCMFKNMINSKVNIERQSKMVELAKVNK